MAVMMKLWDRAAVGGAAQIEMASLKAKEAVKYDPDRYSIEEPKTKVVDAAPASGGPKKK